MKYGIIGAGVVGAVLAKKISESGGEVYLFEKELRPAMHTSGRNSGVAHTGIYYNPEKSPLKAEMSRTAAARLLKYCREKNIWNRTVGKIIVAYNEREISEIKKLKRYGEANLVRGLEILEGEERIKEVEPNIRAPAALHVPTASIVDSRAITESYVRDAETAGAKVFLRAKAEKINRRKSGFQIETTRGQFDVDFLINAAGVHADEIAHYMGFGLDYAIIPFRGDYMEVSDAKKDCVHGLVYPPPNPEVPFLGVHFTKMADGFVTIGPNATIAFGKEAFGLLPERDFPQLLLERGFWRVLLRNKKVRRIAPGEAFASFSPREFYERACKMMPSLKRQDMQPAPHRSGIRAQLVKRETGELVDDLVIEKAENQLHILNAVSPAMTLSLPFADYVAEKYLGI